MRNLNILIAEDDAQNQAILKLILVRRGHRVKSAWNGIQAVEAVKAEHFDLVLMDVQMPEMDGLEATRSIRSKYPTAHQPRIVAMTANAMQGDREECLAAGMNDYVSKPIQVKELISALERAAGEKG